jgi:hypothetical protein
MPLASSPLEKGDVADADHEPAEAGGDQMHGAKAIPTRSAFAALRRTDLPFQGEVEQAAHQSPPSRPQVLRGESYAIALRHAGRWSAVLCWSPSVGQKARWGKAT